MCVRFSLGTGFLYINKHVCKQIRPVWLQGRKDCFSCYSLSLPMNNLFCRSWFCLLTSSERHLQLFLLRLSYNAAVSRCFFFSARGKLISCPSSLLPPPLLVSLVALVVFPCRYFWRLGPAFNMLSWSFYFSFGGRFTEFYFTAWPVTFYESASLSRVDT